MLLSKLQKNDRRKIISELKKAKESIARAKDIAIASHVNPDGDSIGSLLSLGIGLESIGKRVYMISSDGVPERYRCLPGAGRIIKKTDKQVDLAIGVDCSSKEILGKTFESFKSASNILEIDHHDFRRPFGNIKLVDSKAAAVGELIYLLLEELDADITKDVAQNLMTSIVVETNSFRLPNVRPLTFEVCTKLINLGINFYKLVDTIFWSKRKESAILSGVCMARCRFIKGGRVAWSVIRRKDFNMVRGRDEDVDGVPDEMRSIQSVKIALLFREKERNTLRVSLRSKDKINVASIAEKYGGGGHFDVAGCNIPNSAKAIKEFLRLTACLLP